MKSFQLHSDATKPPPPLAAKLPPQEVSRLREVFRPMAAHYRRRMKWAGMLLALSFAFVLLGALFPQPLLPWCAGGFMACWLALIVIGLLSPMPACPACHHRLDRSLGTFCPSCGSQALKHGNWLRPPACASCGQTKRRGKSQGAIRACTNCGIMLDEKGL